MSAETSRNPAYLHRTLESAVKRASGQFKGVLINGMHGAGKHTLLAALSDARPRVSLLTNRERQLAQDDPEAFLTKPRSPSRSKSFSVLLPLPVNSRLCSMRRMTAVVCGSRLPNAPATLSRLMSLYEIVGQGLGQKPWKPTGTLTRGTLPAMTAGDVWERIWFGSMPGLNPLVP